MKSLFILFLITASFFSTAQPSANMRVVNGVVLNTDSIPVTNAIIYLDSKHTSSDSAGKFLLNLKIEEIHHIKIVSIGYITLERKVHIRKNKRDTVDFTFVLQPDDNELPTVEIVGRSETGYQNTRTFIGSKVATADKDLPQSVAFVTKELMLDQGETRVGDLVKNMPGVGQYSFYDDIVIRGFRVNGGTSSTQLYNGLRTITGFWKQSITSYLERIEVLKGPASALYGNASPGGVLNRVTKKPLIQRRYSVNFSTGSFNTIRANADLTGPANAAKTLLYRLNIGYENAQSFRDLQYDKGYIIAPSVSFLPNEKTRINVDLVINQSNSRLDRGQAVIGNNSIYSVSVSRSLNMINDYLNEANLLLTASLNHKFTQNFQFNLGYLKTSWQEDLLEHRSANTRAKDSSGNLIPNLVEMQVFIRKRSIYADNLTSYFSWDIATGPVKHRLVGGYDYAQTHTPWGASQLTASGYRNRDNTLSLNYNSKNPANYQ